MYNLIGARHFETGTKRLYIKGDSIYQATKANLTQSPAKGFEVRSMVLHIVLDHYLFGFILFKGIRHTYDEVQIYFFLEQYVNIGLFVKI